MRPRRINQILRTATLSAAALMVVSGVGLGSDSGVLAAQRQPKNPPPPIQNNPAMIPTLDQPIITGPDPARVRMDEERMKAMNDDRHKRLASDVDKLVSLTNELKSDIDKTNKDELSVEVIRKAQEIEKLAHDVQSRMKN